MPPTKRPPSSSSPPPAKLVSLPPLPSSSFNSSPSSSSSSHTQTENLKENTSKEIWCTLPPTCHNRPTPLADTKSLEAHYAMYHRHVCELARCGCVFPDERLLALHQTECHDPIAALRKERGEKIFACHIPTCPSTFHTPKARRLHLIDVHKYPKEYFFAVTNKGIGGLLGRWGEGVSLVRGTWRERDQRGEKGLGETEGEGEREEGEDEPPRIQRDKPPHMVVHDEDEDIAEVHDEPLHLDPSTSTSPAQEAEHTNEVEVEADTMKNDIDMTMDDLTNSMTTLAVSRGRVPSVIRFGRGGGGGLGGGGYSQHTTTRDRGGGRGRGWDYTSGGRGGGGDQQYTMRGHGGEGDGRGRGGRGGGRGGRRGGQGYKISDP